MLKYSKRQLLIYFSLSLGNIASGLCYSIQAPLFPPEAERKGATASEYGLVFGVYEIATGVMCIISGKFISKIGVKFMCGWGLFLAGGSCILFGLLDRIIYEKTFIQFAYAIRILEGVGIGAFLISTFSIVSKEYPENSGSVFSVTESCFGLGMILGPIFGGALYSVGGYELPFLLLGCVLLGEGVLTYFLMPSINDEVTSSKSSFISLLKIKPVVLIMLSTLFSAYSLGCVQVGLEPLLRTYNLSPFQIGGMFVINGASYAITTPLWGPITDRFMAPNHVIIVGSLLMVVSFLLLAPAPFIPRPSTLWMTGIALVLHGISLGAHFIGSFVGAKREAIKHGVADDMNTYGLISGLWNFFLSLGCFVGPSLTGYLVDVIGFRWATQLVVVMHMCIIVLFICYDCFFNDSSNQRGEDINLNKSFSKYDSIEEMS